MHVADRVPLIRLQALGRSQTLADVDLSDNILSEVLFWGAICVKVADDCSGDC